MRVRRAAGGALGGALGRRSGQHLRGRAGARARALCERLAQDAVLGKVGFARVLKGKQLEITRSGQRRVWETRKAAGSVQSAATFTCLGGRAHRVGEPGLSDRGNTVQRQRGPRSRLPFSSWRGLAEPLTSVCLKFLTCKVGVVTMFLSGLWGTVTMGKAPGTWRAPRSAGLSFARPNRMLHSRWEEIFQTPSGCPWRCKYTGSGTTRSYPDV